MRQILSILAVLMFAVAARAQVLVYNQAINVTKSGGGVVYRWTETGWLLQDPTSNDLVRVTIDAGKRFRVERLAQWSVVLISRPASTLTVLTVTTPGYGTVTLKGVATPANISGVPGSPQFLTIPRSGAGSGSDLSYVSGVDYLTEYSGSVIYNAVRTKSFNAAQPKTMDAAVAVLVSYLTGLGYVAE